MGNSISEETRYAIIELSRNIMNTQCDTLYIGNRSGCTGYIDFILPEDLDNNYVMKGTDQNYRKFIVVKAYIEFKGGHKINTFTTFFQRYSDSETPWMCAGGLKTMLMHSEGGMNLDQFKLLNELLKNNSVDLDIDVIEKCYLNCYPNYERVYNEPIDDNKMAIEIVIGWTDDSSENLK